jgi:aspartyl-tRNA(Asn)/glutamyl-tRNA(Gln) amidotransferase subunit C
VATLARLGLSGEAREQLRDQISAILSYVATLGELDTSKVPPSAQVVPLANVMRPDVVRPSLPVEAVLKNAPERADRFFRVPPVFEES